MSDRDVLGIVFCPTCGCDTMPHDATGQCFFCDTQLVPRNRVAPPAQHHLPPPPVLLSGRCAFCEGVLAHGRTKKRLYCSLSCKQQYWVRYTPAGSAWAARHGRKKAAA